MIREISTALNSSTRPNGRYMEGYHLLMNKVARNIRGMVVHVAYLLLHDICC